MADGSAEILTQEHANACTHLRFLEEKRDKIVLGAVAALGASLLATLTVGEVAGKPYLSGVLFVVFALVGGLCDYLLQAYRDLETVIRFHAGVVGTIRGKAFSDEFAKSLEIRNDASVENRKGKVSEHSECVLKVCVGTAGVAAVLYFSIMVASVVCECGGERPCPAAHESERNHG